MGDRIGTGIGQDPSRSVHRGIILRTMIPLVVALILPLPLLAHAQLLRSSPASKAELVQAPAQIEIWFNELLEEKFNSLKLFPAQEYQSKSRKDLVEGKPWLDSKDRTHLLAKVKGLKPGDYVVEWRVLSRDGHSAPGKFTFRLQEAR